MRHLDVYGAACALTMDQRRGPKPACPMWIVRYLCTSLMRSFACNTNEVCHFCDSNLCPPSIAFCYYYCAEEYCVISPCWKKKNDVAKMRQAGTAPATGTTIYCLSSLWCTVIYKLLALLCTANTLLRANVRLVLQSDLYLSDLLYYLWMYSEFGVSEYSE